MDLTPQTVAKAATPAGPQESKLQAIGKFMLHPFTDPVANACMMSFVFGLGAHVVTKFDSFALLSLPAAQNELAITVPNAQYDGTGMWKCDRRGIYGSLTGHGASQHIGGFPISVAGTLSLEHRIVETLMLGMGIGCLSTYAVSFFTNTLRARRHAAIVAGAIFLQTTATYILMLTESAQALCSEVSSSTGTVIRAHEPLRYIYWLCSTPPIVVMLCNLAGLSPLTSTIGCLSQVIVVAAGLAATILSGSPTSFWGYSALSFGCFIGVCVLLVHSLRTARTTSSDKGTRSLVMLLGPVSLVLWVCFPAFWLLCFFNLVSPTTESLIWPVLDVLAKVLFSNIFVAGDFSRIDAALEQQLRDIEEKRQAADSSNIAKRNFMRYIFHELRVPLNAITLGLNDVYETGDEVRTAIDDTKPAPILTIAATATGESSSELVQQQQQLLIKAQPEDIINRKHNLKQLANTTTSNNRRPGTPSDSDEDEDSIEAYSKSHARPLPQARATGHCQPVPIRLGATIERDSGSLESSALTSPHATTATNNNSSTNVNANSNVTLANAMAVKNSNDDNTFTSLAREAVKSGLGSMRDVIEILMGNATAMGKLLDDFLSLEKIEEGRFTIEIVTFCVMDMVKEATRMFAAPLAAKRLNLAIDIRPGVPELMRGDGHNLRQVLCNYISNAIKFSPVGSTITVKVALTSLKASAVTEQVVNTGRNLPSSPMAMGGIGGRELSSSASEDGDLGGPHSAHGTLSWILNRPSALVSAVSRAFASTAAHSNNVNIGGSSVVSRSSRNTGSGSGGSAPSTINTAPTGTSTNSINFNATDASPRNGATPRARITLIRFSVSDEGVGISREDQAKLFQPFSQIKAGALQKGNGTGLGLSICKRIIELSGGRVGLKSRENEGSTFYFLVPPDGPPKKNVDIIDGRTSAPASTLGPAANPTPSSSSSPSSSTASTSSSKQAAGSPTEHHAPTINGRPGFIASAGTAPGVRASIHPSSDGSNASSYDTTPTRSNSNSPNFAARPSAPQASSDSSQLPPAMALMKTMERKPSIRAMNPSDEKEASVKRINPVSSFVQQSAVITAPSNVAMDVLNAAPHGAPASSSAPPAPMPASTTTTTTTASSGTSAATVGSTDLLFTAVVVDDVKSNRDLFGRLLQRRGVTTVHYAEDGQQALALLSTLNREQTMAIQAWFLDKEMPNCDGHECARQLRAMGVRAPIFGITGNALAEDQREFVEAGASTVVTKPMQAAHLEATLLQHGLRLPKSGPTSSAPRH